MSGDWPRHELGMNFKMFKKLIGWAWAWLKLSLHKFLLSSRIVKAQVPKISNFECLKNPSLFSSWAWALGSRGKHEVGMNFDLFKKRTSGVFLKFCFLKYYKVYAIFNIIGLGLKRASLFASLARILLSCKCKSKALGY